MNRQLSTAVLLLLLAVPALAQSADTVVATVNGEKITQARLDTLWNRMSAKMRAQYDASGGGKLGFLQNYIGKKLVLQSALKSGYDKSAQVQAELEAAKEAALFDLYVRDVVGGQIVTEEEIRKYYDDHRDEFIIPERALLRIIHVSKANRPPTEARQIVSNVMQGLFAARTSGGFERLRDAFAAAAQQSSEHPTAADGGDLGWVTREQLETKVGEAAFTMQKGAMSGIVESEKGFQLLLLEDRAEPTTEPFESVRPAIREYLMGANVQRVMELLNKTTNDLRTQGKVEVFAERVQ
jgi:peptidyl-prolyl cis-trans isomerase C